MSLFLLIHVLGLGNCQIAPLWYHNARIRYDEMLDSAPFSAEEHGLTPSMVLLSASLVDFTQFLLS